MLGSALVLVSYPTLMLRRELRSVLRRGGASPKSETSSSEDADEVVSGVSTLGMEVLSAFLVVSAAGEM